MNVITAIRKNGGGGNSDRADLKAAIVARTAAHAEAERRQQAIGRAQSMLRDAEARLQAATAAITDARAEDAKALLSAITDGGTTSVRAIKRARAAEIEATDDVETARAAFEQLEVDRVMIKSRRLRT